MVRLLFVLIVAVIGLGFLISGFNGGGFFVLAVGVILLIGAFKVATA